MKTADEKAKLGQDDKLAALKRLDDEARRVERHAAGPSVPEVITEERRLSPAYGGRSVFGWEPTPEALERERKPKSASNRASSTELSGASAPRRRTWGLFADKLEIVRLDGRGSRPHVVDQPRSDEFQIRGTEHVEAGNGLLGDDGEQHLHRPD